MTPAHEVSEKPHRLYPSVRLGVFLFTFLGCTVLGGGFACFNFAIVCMVNETAVSAQGSNRNDNNFNFTNDQCGLPTQELLERETSGGYDGEFAWDKSTQAHLLAAHAFGAIIPNIPSGLLSDRYGSKLVILGCVIVNTIASALTPVAAHAGVGWLFAVRCLQGFGTGASWPAVVAMVSTWGTRSETGALLTLGSIGFQFGPLLAMATSSLICESRFRWPLIFYLWAVLSGLFVIAWSILYTDDPSRCRFISQDESSYLQKNNMRRGQSKESFWRVPWKPILFSPSAFAVYACQFCSTWSTFYVGEFMPTYSKEVLHFDVRSNGFTSSLPALCQCLSRILFGTLGDRITFGRRSKTFGVKIYTTLCTLAPALSFLLLGFLDCHQTALAVASFCLASTFLATSTVGFGRGGVLIAPRYAGLISSLSNIYAYVAAIIMPYIVGAMTERGTVVEWKRTAFMTSGVLAASFFQYQIFGTAEEQKWAVDDKCTRPDKVFVVGDKESMAVADEKKKPTNIGSNVSKQVV